MEPYYAGIIIPFVLTLLIRIRTKGKKRGLPIKVGGEPGYAIRNSRFTSPVETAWEGITTLTELFEHSCKKNYDNNLLGTRKLVAREEEISNGKSFEKLHLGNYQWLSYGQTFQSVCNFASGLAKLGHKKGERAAIFADTCDKWFIALQACFRRNVTVVTIYASLGEEALCYSFNETEITTFICGYKELKKLENINGQIDSVKRIICMYEEFKSDTSIVSESSSWTITSFSDVEKLGSENPTIQTYLFHLI